MPLTGAKPVLATTLSRFIAVLLVLFPGAGDLLADGFKSWTDGDGRTIEAQLVHYDFATKHVHWRLRNGDEASTELVKLNSWSKWKALFEPPLSRAVQQRWEATDPLAAFASTGGLGICFLLALLLLGALLLYTDFFVFRVSVRMLAGSDHDYFAYFKLLVVTLLLSILNRAIIRTLTAFSSSTAASGGMAVILGIISWVFYIGVLSRHYSVSWRRAFAILMLRIPLYLLVLPIALLFVILPVAALLFLVFHNSIDTLLLRPLQLI